MVSVHAWLQKVVAKYLPAAEAKAARDLRWLWVENKSALNVLTRRSDFQKIKISGQKLRPCSWVQVQFLENQFNWFRCGWTIPRNVGNAVTRNRIRRWCREFFRARSKSSSAAVLTGIDANFIFFSQPQARDFYKTLDFERFVACLEMACSRISARTSKPHLRT